MSTWRWAKQTSAKCQQTASACSQIQVLCRQHHEAALQHILSDDGQKAWQLPEGLTWKRVSRVLLRCVLTSAASHVHMECNP